MKFLWHPITMHHNFGLERKNLDHQCQAGICSPHIFEQSKEKEKYDHEQAYSLEIGDCDFEESIRTDGSSQYSTPILSPVSSIASFKSCFSTLEDFEVEVDSSSREEDKPLETSKQHSSLEDDAITSPKNAEIEIESLVSQNNGDDFENTIQHSKELAFNPDPEHPPNEKPTEILGEEKNAEETTDHWFLGKIEIDPPDPEIANEENGKSGSYKQDEDKEIMYVLNGRFKFLVKKFLEAEGILDSMESGNSWLDVVSSLSWEAAELIKLSVIDWNPMDPGLYVKIKCVARGSPSQSQLIKGLVFKKNTAHRHMPSRLQNPRLLLFQGALGQKTIGLSSFDSMEQEMDYLKATIGMIDACRPDIVLVEKAVSRDIQESLLEKGITLVYDMKLHRLKRISLCTGSPIISSADIPIRTELKQCNNFHIEKFFEEHMCHEKGGRRQNKTLMFFDGCPKPLGCSILLKGDQIENLKKVKRAVKSAVYAAHHLILETSFIEDQREIFADACKINNSLPAVGPNKSLDDITISTTNDIHIFSCKDAYSNIDRMTGEISETSQEILSCENCSSSVKVNGTTRLPHNRTICNFSDNQGILIRHSRQCPEKRIICEPSHLSRIIYYRRFDLPLGKFLQGILIDKEILCSACNETPQAHSYSYTHHNGNLSVMVKKIPPEKHLPGSGEGKIWMWARRVTCGSQKSTTRVLMSDETRGLSFGKFLELSFFSQSTCGNIYQCGRLLFKDWILFFGSGSYVAMFVYSSIDIYTACPPQPVMDFSRNTGENILDREARDLLQEGERLFSDVANLITRIKSEAMKNYNPRIEVNRVERMWREEKSTFEDCLTKIMNNEVESRNIIQSLPFLNQVLLLEQYIWDRRIDSLCSIEFEEVNPKVNDYAHNHSEESSEVNRAAKVSEISISADDGQWPEKSIPHMGFISFLIWKPLSEILQVYKGDLWGESSQNFDFIRTYTPLHLPESQRLVNRYKKWVHFPFGKDLSIISVCEDEISSVISYALCLSHDQHPSDSMLSNGKKSTDYKTSGLRMSVSCPSALSDELLTTNSLSVDHRLVSDTLHPETRVPVGGSSDKSGFTVISLFAEQFKILRSFFCGSEMPYIASMTRCKGWNAQGGKSKALFAKSLDGRLIIKQISRTEFDSFLEFAPEYFKYVSSSLNSGSQTCLAKILGMYQVKQIKNGKETKTDLVVMENLLYGRSISRVYDLKGAVFSRFVSEGSDDPGKVLLDQNFMQDMGAHPFYVTLKTKRLLQRAIWNDTHFLTSIDVMDYSLLIGVDEKRREVVFGIIDYLRQYTWDKKLETWAKASWVVPKNELPTVISPREYRKRFRNFMSRYFLTIPDAS